MVVVFVCCDADFSEAIHVPTFEFLQDQEDAACLRHFFRDNMSHFWAASARSVSTRSSRTPTGFFPAVPSQTRSARTKNSFCDNAGCLCRNVTHPPNKKQPREEGESFRGDYHVSSRKETASHARGRKPSATAKARCAAAGAPDNYGIKACS